MTRALAFALGLALAPLAAEAEPIRVDGSSTVYPLRREAAARFQRQRSDVAIEVGFAGTTVSFVNFRDELPFFIDRVLPLMEQAGLREGP